MVSEVPPVGLDRIGIELDGEDRLKGAAVDESAGHPAAAGEDISQGEGRFLRPRRLRLAGRCRRHGAKLKIEVVVSGRLPVLQSAAFLIDRATVPLAGAGANLANAACATSAEFSWRTLSRLWMHELFIK
jgi:hypothetical protein